MPTYEYRCGACGEEFEKFQRMSDEPGAPCPACGEPAERRMSAGAGLLFKGSGFYITDYRSDSYKNAARSESGGGEKKSDGGGESKGGESKSGESKGGESKGGESKGDAGAAKKAETAPATKPPKKSE